MTKNIDLDPHGGPHDPRRPRRRRHRDEHERVLQAFSAACECVIQARDILTIVQNRTTIQEWRDVSASLLESLHDLRERLEDAHDQALKRAEQ